MESYRRLTRAKWLARIWRIRSEVECFRATVSQPSGVRGPGRTLEGPRAMAREAILGHSFAVDALVSQASPRTHFQILALQMKRDPRDVSRTILFRTSWWSSAVSARSAGRDRKAPLDDLGQLVEERAGHLQDGLFVLKGARRQKETALGSEPA